MKGEAVLFEIPPSAEMIRTARFTKCGTKRFLLTRRWVAQEDTPYVLFVMLNPSTADAVGDDPTIRRCIAFARGWGYGALHVVNLFDHITPHPEELLPFAKAKEEYARGNPVMPLDLGIIQDQSKAAAVTVCGWGAFGKLFPARVREVHAVLTNPHALLVTKDGHPGHPLYLKADLVLKPYALPDREP
jgi:hypothetical protein